MLKEIHHRVKNNLQVVTSLMSIQANRLSDEASKRALAELQRRVRALGLLHRHLYEGDDLRYLDFGQFTVELCQMVKESSGPAARAVKIDVDIPPIPITADRAVPLGLLITEALGNAFKHGFPGGRPGVIRISLAVTAEGVATISISDNGVGPPSALGRERERSEILRHRHAADAGLRPAAGQRAQRSRVRRAPPCASPSIWPNPGSSPRPEPGQAEPSARIAVEAAEAAADPRSLPSPHRRQA